MTRAHQEETRKLTALLGDMAELILFSWQEQELTGKGVREQVRFCRCIENPLAALILHGRNAGSADGLVEQLA